MKKLVRLVGVVVLVLIGGLASTSLAAIEAVVTVEFFDVDDPSTTISEINTGDAFGFRVMVDGPAAGLRKGWVDVTVTSGEITFDKDLWTIDTDDWAPHYINNLLKYMRDLWGSLENTAPQFDNYGGEASLADADGFAADGDWWIMSECSGIAT